MLFPPVRDKITVGKEASLTSDSWLNWLRQITTGVNFIAPTFAGGHTASIDFTATGQTVTPWPGFLVLSYTTVASGLTVKLPVAPNNSIVVISSAVGVANNVVVNATWTLTPGTWITLISNGTNWIKIMGGSL